MPDPQEVDVTVVLKPNQVPPFELKSNKLQGGRLTFQNDHFPGFYVNFRLEDPQQTGYVFPNNENLALAAQRIQNDNDECPRQGQTFGQFKPVKVTDSNKTLRVRNLNQFAARFGYSLFVTTTPNDDSGQFLMLDPIGENQNGPSSFWSFDFLSAGIGFAAAAVALFVAFQFGLFGR
jgi:hypothetical protein